MLRSHLLIHVLSAKLAVYRITSNRKKRIHRRASIKVFRLEIGFCKPSNKVKCLDLRLKVALMETDNKYLSITIGAFDLMTFCSGNLGARWLLTSVLVCEVNK